MWKSVKEYIPLSLRRWVGMIIGGIGAVGTIAQVLGYTLPNMPLWAWLLIMFFGFSVAQFLAFHKLRLKRDELKSELNAIENAKPIITVEPKVYYDDKAILEICNAGASATFTATARVIKGIIESNLFNLYWQFHPNDTTCHINKDDTQAILVAEISPNNELNDNARTAVYKDGIALYQAGGKRIGACDYQVIRDAKLKERYPKMFWNAPELIDECEIEVTITAERQLSKPFNKQRYLIKIDHEHNGKLIFTPVSNSDKKGVQTE